MAVSLTPVTTSANATLPSPEVGKYVRGNAAGTQYESRTNIETAQDLSLGNVDNTADSAKPVSTAQQTALNLKEDAANKDIVNGYAGLDANSEVIKLPAGAAAEITAGRTNSVKRADGTWSALVRQLTTDYALQTWADDLALGAYDVNLTVAQNGLPTGTWYIEVMRHNNDLVSNQFRYLRATPLASTLATKPVYHCSDVNGTWSAWTPVGDAPLTWFTPTFVNSWADLAGGHDARYIKDLTNGIVYMKGLVTGGSDSTTTTIFTLPVGYRPSTTLRIIEETSGGAGVMQVLATGQVQFGGANVHTGNATGFLSIYATFKGEL